MAYIRQANTRILLLVVAPWCVLPHGCGSATRQGPSSEQEPRSASPEEACLEAANGERERNPDEPVRVGLRHILVRHQESKRATASITRTRGQACLRAMQALNALETGETWDQAVETFSDEKGAATRSGSLGSLTRADLDPAFADAAFQLDPDQLSYVVETPAGFHVILRVE